jgi:hypothetical protein
MTEKISAPRLHKAVSECAGSGSIKCSDVTLLHPEHTVGMTMVERMGRFFQGVLRKKNLKFTEYDGYVQYAFLGMAYLMKRHPGNCVIIGDLESVIRRLQESELLDEVDWQDIGFLWAPRRQGGGFSLRAPGGTRRFVEAARSCKKDGEDRFLMSVLTLRSNRGDHHANLLIYDRSTRELERFDPFEANPPGFGAKSGELDTAILRVFLLAYPEMLKMRTPSGLPMFRRMGLQLRQELEGKRVARDPKGFCQPFTILYAELRLTFPSTKPDLILRNLQNWTSEKNVYMTEFIRNYAEELHNIHERVLRDFQRNRSFYEEARDPRVPLFKMYLGVLSQYKTIYST